MNPETLSGSAADLATAAQALAAQAADLANQTTQLALAGTGHGGAPFFVTEIGRAHV